MRLRTAAVLFASVFAASISAGCGGGYRLPKTDGIDAREQVDPGLRLGEARFRLAVCDGVDVRPDFGTLDDGALVTFLQQRGIAARLTRERTDLVYVDLQLNPGKNEWVRLRVATLGSRPQAGAELYRALREKGDGTWGVHRANLAILGPAGDVEDIIALAAKTKLACWGVLTIADRGDVFVVPGAYREL